MPAKRRLRSQSRKSDDHDHTQKPIQSEKPLEQAIGIQVRSLRTKGTLTIAELAKSAGLSAGTLSKIENGQISASLGTLQTLANALHTPIATFFGPTGGGNRVSHVPAGGGVLMRRGSKAGHQYRLLRDAACQDMLVEPCLVTYSDTAQPNTALKHDGIEFIHMLSGEIEYALGERKYLLRTGDSLLFEGQSQHGPSQFIKLPASLLSIVFYRRS